MTAVPVAASSSRFSPLLRWIGLTLVVLLVLQLAAVVSLGAWGEESFRQLLVERLVSQSPMALVGLLLMYVSSRQEDASGSRTPLLWSVCIISGLLAVLLTASLPVAFGGDQMIQQQSDAQLKAGRDQLTMMREQSKNPEAVQQLIKQIEASGRLPAGASDEQKEAVARNFIQSQLDQLETQVKKAEQTTAITLGQRRFANSGGAVVLIIAFTILCLASIL